MLKQQVLDTIKKNRLINYGDGIVVGISGGYDSVCLLHILYSIAEEYSLKLYPVHVNHMLRGEEAMRDESFVKDLCGKMGLEAVVERIDIANKALLEKISLEEAGRNARYEIFNRVLEEKSAHKIAVAHSKNDQAETLLMRLFRGTGPEGLKGIEYKRDNIIRPLLDAERGSIEGYVDGRGLEAITDSSNLHTDFFRNRIRLKVLPEINAAAGADITDNLLRLSKILVADEDYLRYNSELYYKRAVVEKRCDFVELDLESLSQLHRAVCSRVLRLAFSEASQRTTGLEYIHIDKLLQLIAGGRTGSRLDLPFGYMAVKSYSTIAIQKHTDHEIERFEFLLSPPCEIEISGTGCKIKAEIHHFDSIEQCRKFLSKKQDSDTEFFDYDKIENRLCADKNFQLVVRNRRDGDIFKPLRANGTKKLKEYFIDIKIPREQRDSFPLISINKEIIWIIGNKTSDNYKVTDNTKSVLMITYMKFE
ncbi:tRNA(Ile)-lysidine synthase [Ruminiclostridium hungatei]|uniref:tRNA(Ile)-lysidine synthase n=1 Tax=Ruminiclostridium hungatei TaxID=48256 RepID=A0A1V4SQG2_RUMHU|nr:tRNA lysidine(34) synthetase TilS [Ruminiclostridium hungatei]OPX45695.1 tRNA(Ile)-lysidine synthase [Ruminiclostridium hungatei]